MDTEDQIPPPLPLQKGGITPLWQRGGEGRFSEAYFFFIMDSLVKDRIPDQVRNDNIVKSLLLGHSRKYPSTDSKI
jgi:hypothetical protein